MERLKGRGFTLNEDKCVRFSRELSFLGYKISADGISPDEGHVTRLRQMKVPTDKKQVETFVGFANYFGRMIPDFASKVAPRNQLRRKDRQFRWTKECDDTFNGIIEKLTSCPIVKPYSLAKEVTLTTDASKTSNGPFLRESPQ